MLDRLRNIAKILFGLLAFLLGLILTPLPLPFGLPLLFLGSFLIVQNFPPAKRAWQNFRKRHPKLDRRIGVLQVKFESWRRRHGW